MKRLLLFFCLCVACITESKAQEETDVDSDTVFYSAKPSSEGKTRFGVCLGLQTSFISGSEATKTIPLIGINGGAYIRYNFAKKFTLQPALTIGFKGSKFDYTAPEYYNSLKLLYIEAPIQVFYTYQKEQKNQLGTGIYFAKLMNANLASNGGALVSNQSTLPIRELDWGLVGSWQVKLTYFYLQTSYKLGLYNFNTGAAWPSGDNASVIKPLNKGGSFYNQTFSVQLIF